MENVLRCGGFEKLKRRMGHVIEKIKHKKLCKIQDIFHICRELYMRCITCVQKDNVTQPKETSFSLFISIAIVFVFFYFEMTPYFCQM